jgi:hypothetical protein
VSALPTGFTLGAGRTLSGGGTVAGQLTAASNSVVSPGTAGVGVLTITNGFTCASGAQLAIDILAATNHDAVSVTGGNVALACELNASISYSASIGDTVYLVRNLGSGTTTGTLSGQGDGGKLDLGGKWWRVSFTSAFGGSGFAVGGPGNDVALQRIDDPSPSGIAASIVGATNEAVANVSLSWADNASGETGYRVYRVWDDGTLELLATLGANATAYTNTVSAYTSATFAVEAFNAGGSLGDLTYSDPVQVNSSLEDRHDAMLDFLSTEVPNLGQFGAGPHRIGRTGFWCATGRMLRNDTNTGVSYITTAVEDATAEGSNSGFSMWPGMDAYLRWNHLFPQSLLDRYEEVYVGATVYDDGSTPNQRFMLATASYLANGVWGPSVNSNASAANGMGGAASGRDFILHILNKTPFQNHEEHNASHYLQYTLAAIETLAEFAQDDDVRQRARMVVDWSMAEASGYMQNGRWCVSATRGKASQYQDEYDITGWTWHLLFGGPYPSSYFDSFATAPFLTTNFPGVWTDVERAGQERTRSYTRRSLAQRYLSGGDIAYFKQCWMTPGHALWSQVEGDITYNADGSLNLVDLNTSGIQDGYQGNRWGLAWDDPPWYDSRLLITSPTTYSGSTGGISVWEDTLQLEDTMIAVYNMPVGGGGSTGNNGNWANEYLTGHIPGGYQALINESTNSGRIFLHYEKVLIAIYLSRTFSWSTNFTVSGVNKAALAIETAPVSEYTQSTAAARLAAFRSAVLAVAPDISGVTNSAPRFVYTTRHGRVLDLTFGLAGKTNGVSVDYASWPMLEDPWMYQAQEGHLHVFGTNRVTIANYRDWTNGVNNRPTLAGGSTVSAVAGSPVDVDLGARVDDTETADTNLAFTVTNAVGGTVALLADGRTARFTPAAGSNGVASFDFTASDRGLHPRVVLHYDYEPPATLVSNVVRDASLQRRDATLGLVLAGTAVLTNDVPTACGANSTRSLRLTENGTNGAARLLRTLTRSNLELNNGSWTFSTWLKRATRTTDDFFLYLGASDGFGGNGEELEVRCAANADIVRLEHYNATNALAATIISPGGVTTGVWHHVALTFERSGDNSGTLRLYVNGALAGSPTPVSWALQQNLSVVFGGILSTAPGTMSRYFNGWLDDTAMFRGALSAAEIARLSKQSVATFSGLSVGEQVPLNVITQYADWRQTHFGSTNNTGNGADSGDVNGDGESNLHEFGTGQDPRATTRAMTAFTRNGSTMEYTYTRGLPAILDGLTFAVQWSDTLLPGSWSEVGVTEQILSDNGLVQTVRATVPAGSGAQRFARLRVTRP